VKRIPNFIFLFTAGILFSSTSFSQTKDEAIDSGKASYYHENFDGLQTSSVEEFDKNDFTAAHRTLPFNSIVSVTNLKNGKSAIVRINDRGPFNKKRIIDISPSAAKKIGMTDAGVIRVRINTLSLLDRLPLSDTIFKEGEIWNCYGDQSELESTSIYIWQSEFFKHAFYMATALALDYSNDSIVVRVVGNLNRRVYQVLATGVNGKESSSLLKRLANDGFTPRIFKIKK
jgi:rare lipoprotein A